MENKIKNNYNLFSHFYAHIWIHISAFDGQGDLQDLSTNFGIEYSIIYLMEKSSYDNYIPTIEKIIQLFKFPITQ